MQGETPDGPAEAEAALIQLEGEQDAVAVSDPELGVRARRTRPVITTPSSTGDDTELDTRPNSAVDSSRSSTFGRIFSGSGFSTPKSSASVLPPKLASLVQAYAISDVAAETKEEIKQATVHATANGHVDGAAVVLRAYKRAGWLTQFQILSGRSFKNLYRNPMLMLSHYAVSVIVAGAFSTAERGGSQD